MMLKSISKKSQAMVELAVLGALFLMGVSFVVTYVAKLNNDQWTLMEAFRRGLAKAHDTNQIVSYGTWDDRRMASVQEPITGQKTPSSGSSCISWSIPSVQGSGQDPQGSTYVKVNGGIWAIPGLNEYNLGPGAGGGIEPLYVTVKGSQVTINSDTGSTTSTHSAGTGEFMLYKINGKNYPQARASGAARTYSGSY